MNTITVSGWLINDPAVKGTNLVGNIVQFTLVEHVKYNEGRQTKDQYHVCRIDGSGGEFILSNWKKKMKVTVVGQLDVVINRKTGKEVMRRILVEHFFW